jgi:hypothetical protein
VLPSSWNICEPREHPRSSFPVSPGPSLLVWHWQLNFLCPRSHFLHLGIESLHQFVAARPAGNFPAHSLSVRSRFSDALSLSRPSTGLSTRNHSSTWVLIRRKKKIRKLRQLRLPPSMPPPSRPVTSSVQRSFTASPPPRTPPSSTKLVVPLVSPRPLNLILRPESQLPSRTTRSELACAFFGLRLGFFFRWSRSVSALPARRENGNRLKVASIFLSFVSRYRQFHCHIRVASPFPFVVFHF